MKERYFSLIKDLLLFTMSTFVPKAISFLLVPLYTNCLSTVEYGIADMITTTVSFAIPFLTLNISDAVLRFTIDNKKDRRPLQIAYKVVIFGIVLLLGLILLNVLFSIYSIKAEYELFLGAQYILTVIFGINISYLRATDRVFLLSVTSIVNTGITVTMNILMLLVLKTGLLGYLASNTLGLFVVNVVISNKIGLIKLMRGISVKHHVLKQQMLSYSIPLISSSVGWWINSASDRYFVTYFCGISENGIYSIAYKIPTVLQLLQSVFSQAWMLTIYREYDKNGGHEFVGKIYNLYNSAMCISCAFLIILDIPIARFMYAKDFFTAWKYVPILLISVVFIANAGFFETIITLYKKSRIVATTAVIGAVVNVILNIMLIYIMGVFGAAIATVCGYFVMWMLRIKIVMKDYPFYVNWLKQGLLIAMLVVEAFVMICFQNYYLCTAIMITMCIIDFKTLFSIINQVIIKVKGI